MTNLVPLKMHLTICLKCSLEDRIVKQYFKELTVSCTCPKELPICICGGKAKGKLITKKPIEADAQEQEENRRSRSAKLRIIEKL